MKVLDWLPFVYFLINLVGCQTLRPVPKTPLPLATIWNGRIYLGDSRRLGVAQSLASPVVSCGSQEFDRLICMSVEDYTALMQYFLQAACVNQ